MVAEKRLPAGFGASRGAEGARRGSVLSVGSFLLRARLETNPAGSIMAAQAGNGER